MKNNKLKHSPYKTKELLEIFYCKVLILKPKKSDFGSSNTKNNDFCYTGNGNIKKGKKCLRKKKQMKCMQLLN